MNIALIGYGKMGREIEKLLNLRGHSVVLVVDDANRADLNAANLLSGKTDIAMEFSTPETAYDNIVTCLEAGVGVVCGTTGWLDRYGDVAALCERVSGAFFYAPNYSLGVNIFFRLNEALAKMMDRFGEYDVRIGETHHIHKKDAPSGTAIALAEGVAGNVGRKRGWKLGADAAAEEIPVVAERRGEVPGIHTVRWESQADMITITHEAKGRGGLALGAVLAAEFMHGRKGVFSMSDLLGF